MTGHCKDCDYHDKYDWVCSYSSWVGIHSAIAEDSCTIYAEALDDSGLVCGLKVGPMFGCVKFKAKKKE